MKLFTQENMDALYAHDVMRNYEQRPFAMSNKQFRLVNEQLGIRSSRVMAALQSYWVSGVARKDASNKEGLLNYWEFDRSNAKIIMSLRHAWEVTQC